MVVPGKSSILNIGDVDDEKEYDAFEDLSPFISPKSMDEDDVDVCYVRIDHTEGIHLN